MLVAEAMRMRMSNASEPERPDIDVALPRRVGTDSDPVRTGMMKRLAHSRLFALGDRAGVLRAAQRRSGQAFRLDVRQRVIVKALVSRHTGRGAERSAALAAHLAYLGRAGAGAEGARPEFFDRHVESLDVSNLATDWRDDRHHFRFIISPEHGERLELQAFVREVMRRVSADLGEPDLTWAAVCHYDTDQPHAHVLVRGRRGDGRDLVIPRDYIAYGFRARAQEVAQERLGDLSRVDAERRIWRETSADRFTAFDRRLLAAADADLSVADGVGGTDAWTALTRGRLRHLERLGLATPLKRRYQLNPELETKLRTLQIRRDILRTLNQRRLEAGRDVQPLGRVPVRGKVVRTGFHDELGASPYAIIRAANGVEYYGRLRAGARLEMGKTVVLVMTAQGLTQVVHHGRGADLGR